LGGGLLNTFARDFLFFVALKGLYLLFICPISHYRKHIIKNRKEKNDGNFKVFFLSTTRLCLVSESQQQQLRSPSMASSLPNVQWRIDAVDEGLLGLCTRNKGEKILQNQSC
jgi:hypothetical protein